MKYLTAVLLTLLTGCSVTPSYNWVQSDRPPLPPVINDIEDYGELKRICNRFGAYAPRWSVIGGCAVYYPNRCEVYLHSESSAYYVAKNHELNHCGGKDHD